MAKVKNISPLGDLIVPVIGLTVPAGQSVEVADDIAASLLAQTANWVAGDSAPTPTITPDAPAAQN